MTRASQQPTDRRQNRSRLAIIEAFNALVRENRLENIRVPDITARANVGRSTFYEHFANVTDVYLTAFARPLSILADSLTGQDNHAELVWLLDHLWENRHQARSAFSGRGREQLSKLLLTLMNERAPLADDDQSLMRQLARIDLCEGTMGLLRAWLINDVTAPLAQVADTIMTRAAKP
ncbi:MAG: TetR/AcrR family transcriptional regulator [Lysobacterales bacterium]